MNEAPRVMWLLNHKTLREFEIAQMHAMGITEIFLPKRFPYDEANLSANVTDALDAGLRMPPEQLELLNGQDWYGEPSAQAWEIANRHFDVAFIGFFPRQIESAIRCFEGAIVVRAFGLSGQDTYAKLLRKLGGERLDAAIRGCGRRFWFGMGYPHLADIELPLVADRAVHLPVGLKIDKDHPERWEGKARQIFFVCPRIGTSLYFNEVYREFRRCFGDLEYVIGGAQPVEVNDPRVLGFVPQPQHEYNMMQSRVMFYHSREPYHVHFHPFEAIAIGMPLVFMAGGMLDRLGGRELPGRCETMSEARRKIERILDDDRALIAHIRASQRVLLDPLRPEQARPAWQEGFQRILAELSIWRAEQEMRPPSRRRRRIAVVIPVAYRGGTLRGAQLLARAIEAGSEQAGEAAEVVLLHLDREEDYPDEAFADLPVTIARRPYRWRELPPDEARRAMRYAGFAGWEPDEARYQVPDDGIRQLQDCDLWVIVSDRLPLPVLPLKPIVLMVYDYLQRYVGILSYGASQPFLDAARRAERVFVTTDFNYWDAVQFAGLDPYKVRRLPMLTPAFVADPQPGRSDNSSTEAYFIWTTNAAPHKNHVRAAEALCIYYEEFDGRLDCRITGTNTASMLEGSESHLKKMAALLARNRHLRERVKWQGELPDREYRRCLAGARFLWHAGQIDNGTFSVVEAAYLGIPSLSSDYPAMREMDAEFSLNLAWMDPYSPRQMAEQLKNMEQEADARRAMLPSAERLAERRVEALAHRYWEELRACL